jgi:hypothetical protein
MDSRSHRYAIQTLWRRCEGFERGDLEETKLLFGCALRTTRRMCVQGLEIVMRVKVNGLWSFVLEGYLLNLGC